MEARIDKTPEVPARKKRQPLRTPMENGKENSETGVPPKKPRRHDIKDSAISVLEERITREQKIRDGASKLLQVSKTPGQMLEASKGLFVSNAKLIALMKDLQERKAAATDTSTLHKGSQELEPCKALLAISDVRVPLEWKEFEHMKGKTDTHMKYGVFCLFKVGNQVMDTPAMVEVDRSMMDISLKDTVIFPEKVDTSFVLDIEVYSSLPPDDTASKVSTPIKMIKKLRTKDKVEDSPLPSSSHLPPGSPLHGNSVSPYRFALAGHTQLTLKDVSGSCRTYTLKRGAVGASGTASTSHDGPLLPLWGQICCKLMVQPECAGDSRKTGFINVHRMVSGLPDWVRLWCVVRQNHLRCWNYPEDVGRKMPTHTIELTEGMSVENAPRITMRRPNSIIIKEKSTEYVLAFESREERDEWSSVVKQAIVDLKAWRSSCDYVIAVPNSKFYTASPSLESFDINPSPPSDSITTSSAKPRPASITITFPLDGTVFNKGNETTL